MTLTLIQGCGDAGSKSSVSIMPHGYQQIWMEFGMLLRLALVYVKPASSHLISIQGRESNLGDLVKKKK